MSPHKPLPAKDLICKEYSISKLWPEAAGKRKVSALLAVHPGGSLGDDRVVKRDNGLCAAPHKEEEFDEEDEDEVSKGQGAVLAIILALGFVLAMPAEAQFICGGSADGTNGLNGAGATATGALRNGPKISPPMFFWENQCRLGRVARPLLVTKTLSQFDFRLAPRRWNCLAFGRALPQPLRN